MTDGLPDSLIPYDEIVQEALRAVVGRVLGEVDGQTKYGPLLLPGQDVREVVRREKEREDALREASRCGMIRFTSRDLHVPDRTDARVRRALHI